MSNTCMAGFMYKMGILYCHLVCRCVCVGVWLYGWCLLTNWKTRASVEVKLLNLLIFERFYSFVVVVVVVVVVC